MQRFDRERHVGLLRVIKHLGKSIVNLRPRACDVFGSCTSRPRILRQATDDKHDAGGAQRAGLIDDAAVVVACLDPVRRIGDKHAAAAIA